MGSPCPPPPRPSRTADPAPSARRADPDRVRAAVTAAATFGDYFVATTEPGEGTSLRDLRGDHSGLRAVVDGAAAALRVDEPRVAAAQLHYELAERLWSLALGTWATGELAADLGPLRCGFTSTAVTLALPSPGGWDVADPTELAALLTHTVVDEQLRPLHDALRAVTRVATGLLWGNAAAGLVLAARAVTRSRPDPRVGTLVTALLAAPPLRGTLDGRWDGPVTRRSCCLYYRVPNGRPCGDCPLTGAAVVGGAAARRRAHRVRSGRSG
ncbi:FhuF 2Fe-2S C-terminal domain-containing protein [Amycolatopsis arida]|uniref:FhuF 2Fe-2S C-terminal domain-containing protein n=1 Tax=Amycolatopsis arida TaxID=587909 RepID=A0A1I5Z3B3_9PSEU|nr:(2Fe-2S)-binding protein [Amycolatopsis arida]TDX90064.1 FhuF-like iron-sulfur protein [Amycolatopsis arida]SFQ50607.1 FhuF 2Fe-2S C-terminal domain-containing protein [Amycolatopsis arida]